MIGSSAEVTISKARILENSGRGIRIGSSGPLISVLIVESLISGNGWGGIYASTTETGGDISVSIRQTEISGNEGDGLVMGAFLGGSVTMEVRNVAILGNGTRPQCQKHEWFFTDMCNGITVGGEGANRMIIADSVIRGNTDWGVAAFLEKCGYDEDDFSGEVVFEGANVIEGNNTAGNHKGEVCLP